MKKDNVFWGVLLLFAAVYIIINALGFAPDVSLIKLVIAVVCVIALIKSIAQIEFGGILFSVAVLLILFDKMLGITAITPWPVLIAALFGSIGLNMIFGNKKKVYMTKKKRMKAMESEFVKGEDVVIGGSFSGCKKSISSDNFKRAKISCQFCGMEISFDDAVIQNGMAVIDLDVSFSGVELYVPASWEIVDHTDCVLGSFEEQRGLGRQEVGPTVEFKGKIRFSGVEIYRI